MTTVSPELEAALAATEQSVAVLVELSFASGPLRLWTGIGDLEWADMTFTGTGAFGKFDRLPSSGEVQAEAVRLTLTGMPRDMLALAEAERWKNRPVRIWLALLDETDSVLGAVGPWRGRMDTMAWTVGETVEFTLTCESEFVAVTRAPIRRYTADDQRGEFPGDAAFDAVASLQGRTIRWGMPDA